MSSKLHFGDVFELINNIDCAEELERYEDVDDALFLEYFNVDPLDILQAATDKCLTESASRGLIGSSTALLAVLRRDVLRVANLGDCNSS